MFNLFQFQFKCNINRAKEHSRLDHVRYVSGAEAQQKNET